MSTRIEYHDAYSEKLVKLIPADVVAAYLAVQGVIPKPQAKWGLAVVAILLVIIMPFYLKKFHKHDSTKQIVLSCFSFVIWVYALGGPFSYFNIQEPWIASVIMILWTTFVPQFIGSPQNTVRPITSSTPEE